MTSSSSRGARAAGCRWADRTSGATSSRASSSGGGWTIVALYGLTAPLITTATGEKMGKTARGAVWLDPARVSPYEYWQFWRNTPDADVARFLSLFTELDEAEIDAPRRARRRRDQ